MITQRPRRRGYTLIEMLLVISGLAILFGMSVGLIHMLLRLDRGNRTRLGEAATVSRLARQFRGDAHAATAARLVEDKDREGIALVLPGGRTVQYVDEGNRLVRHDEAKGEPPRHEAYRMPSRGRPKLALRDEGDQRWATLVLEPNSRAKDIVPARPVMVEAWVGKYTRLARREEVPR